MICKGEIQEHQSRRSFLVQRRDLPYAQGFRVKIREEKEKKEEEKKPNPTSILFCLPFSIGWARCPCRHEAADGPACPESAQTCYAVTSAVCLYPSCPSCLLLTGQSIYPLTLHLWSCVMDPPLWRCPFCCSFLIFSMLSILRHPGYLHFF